MTTFNLTAGLDNFTGAAGQQNTFFFTPSTLQGTDTLTGGATGGFIDVLSVTAGGTITSGQFAGVTLVEELDLSSAGNNVTLTNALVAGTSQGYFLVSEAGGTNDNTVDASGITNGTEVAFVASSTGTDTLLGGSGNDVFIIGPANLTSTDTINGGTGFDYIEFNQAGTVSASALAGVSHVEALVFDGAGNSVTLSDSLVNSSDAGLFQIRAIGSGNNTFDGSALTSTRTLIFYSGTGADTLKGGQGNDAFVFTNPGDLTAADTVSGGVGDDAILFVNGGIVAANAFNNVTGIEEMALSFSGNSVTLTDALVAGSSVNAFAVAAQGGTNVVDASGVTNGISITFIGATGADTFKGGNGSDGFVLDASMLTSADTIQGGGGTDAIYLQGSGTVASSAFTNVTGVEILVLQGGDSNITLNNASALTSSAGAFFIVDNASNNTIDASAFRTASINVIAGSGNDTFKGGDANDVFSFNAADLTAADTVIGGNGAGADTLVIKNNGTVTTAASAGVSQIEAVQLAAGGEFDFANSLANDLAVFAIGSGAVDKLDASAVTSYALQMFSNGGADTLIGGSQNDTFRIADAAFAAINGNGGIDRITLTTPSQSFNLTANAAKITNVEVIDLTSATAATLSLNGNDISLVNASGNSLYVVGDADDTVGAGLTPGAGLGFTLIASGVINNAVAPGHTFNEYQHSSGALLFVDSAVLLF